MTGGVFLHAELFAPWCIQSKLSPEDCAPFLGPTTHLILYHYVIEGELLVRMAGNSAETMMLRAGEAILFPNNDLHVMGSDIRLAPVDSHALICPPDGGGLFTIHHGGNGPLTRLICGFIGCDSADRNPIFATLPPALRLTVDTGGAAEWIRSTFQFAAAEVAAGRPGSETVLAKLSELLFVESVRRYVESLPDGATGWLAGLRDPYVSRTLALFHRDVTCPWTLEELGRAVGLSRSALADRFTRMIGIAPMHYLANWRLQVARQQLRSSSASLAQVAEAVGYESEASFSRAFKKVFGIAPGAWRRSQ